MSLAHKYVGYLLHNQRQSGEIDLFSKEHLDRFSTGKSLNEMLAQELHKNKVARVGHFHRPQVHEHLHPSVALAKQ